MSSPAMSVPAISSPSSEPAVSQQCDSPLEVRLSPDRTRLTLQWADGAVSVLSAAHLRAHSPSAGARRARLAGLSTPVAADLTVSAVHLLGGYALNLVFSDGHDRGIYPWALLKALGAEPSAEPNAIP
ncbi:gamma-butyrobetaine hydroxylase-like domain-containing protein [Xanthobacter sp. ZOL 2024]